MKWLKLLRVLVLIAACQAANAVGALASYVPTAAIGIGTGSAPAPPVVAGFAIGTGGNAGKFINTLTGTPFVPIGVSLSGCEIPNPTPDGLCPGIAAVTSSEYTSGFASLVATYAMAVKPYVTFNFIRIAVNSCSYMGYTGVSAFNTASGHYYSVGTDTNGRAIWSCGVGGGLGTGPGHETSGDPSAYQASIDTIIQNATAAGLNILIDLHWGTMTWSATGQYIMPEGQPSMPGPGDTLFWAYISNKYKAYPNVGYELYNEPYGSDNGSNFAAESAWLGNQNGAGTQTTFLFPTSTTSPAGVGNGCLMQEAYSGGAFNVGVLGGGQTCTAVSMQAMLNAIRATGSTQVVLAGSVNFTGDPALYSAAGLGGAETVTDSLHQLAFTFHAYSWNFGGAAMSTLYAIQTAGYGMYTTEIGCIASSGCTGPYPSDSSYSAYMTHGIGYAPFAYNNFNGVSNIYNQGGGCMLLPTSGCIDPFQGNGSTAPTGSNFRPAPPIERLHGHAANDDYFQRLMTGTRMY